MVNYQLTHYAASFFGVSVVLYNQTAYFCATIKEDGSVNQDQMVR